MRHLRLAAIVVPALLLAACGGGTPPAQPQASSAAPAPTPAVTTPAKADDLKPLLGNWGLDPANCGDQVLKISTKRFEGPGSGCDITGFTDNGDGTYIAAMSCVADGQTSKERIQMRPIFAPTGEGIDLVYLDRKGLKSEVLRCDATK
ncbi:MAG: hypothetical protein ABI398_03805 [Devosia sp.]